MKRLFSVLGVFFFLSLVLIFYNLRLGLLLTTAAILGLSPMLWKLWKLMHTTEGLEALEALDKGQKEISLEEIPPRLIALLIAVLIISYLGFFGIFRFNPFIDLSFSILTVLLLAYYFLRKRRIQNQKKENSTKTLQESTNHP